MKEYTKSQILEACEKMASIIAEYEDGDGTTLEFGFCKMRDTNCWAYEKYPNQMVWMISWAPDMFADKYDVNDYFKPIAIHSNAKDANFAAAIFLEHECYKRGLVDKLKGVFEYNHHTNIDPVVKKWRLRRSVEHVLECNPEADIYQEELEKS